MVETSKSQANNSLLSTFSNESFGLTTNVRKSGDAFEVIVVDAISGEEVLSTHRPTQEEAEKFAFGLMNPSHDPTTIRLRAGSRASFVVPETWIKSRRTRGEYK